jgi:hypothetical protein
VFLNLNEAVGSRTYAPLRYQSTQKNGFTQVVTLNGWQIGLQQWQTDGSLAAVAGAPELQLLSSTKLSLRLSPEMLGFPASVEALEVTVLTWDSAGEGALRPLQVVAGDYSFGGAQKTDAPMWMDKIEGIWRSTTP